MGGVGSGGRRWSITRKGKTEKLTNKRLREHAASGGILPLEYMLRIMRNSKQPKERRDEMAKAAAPYLHPKLQSITTSRTPIDLTKLTDEQLRLALELRRSLSAGRGDSDGIAETGEPEAPPDRGHLN